MNTDKSLYDTNNNPIKVNEACLKNISLLINVLSHLDSSLRMNIVSKKIIDRLKTLH